MRKKILNTVLATAAIATMSIASTYASTLDSVGGQVKFVFDGLDSASTYQVPGTCNDVTTCDNLQSSGSYQAVGSEDTWGIAQITSIKGGGPISYPDTLWSNGDGDYLIAYFRGFTDTYVASDGSGITFEANGGEIFVYRSSDTSAFVNARDAIGSGRAAVESALGVGTSLYLHLNAVVGCTFDDFDGDVMTGNPLNLDATLCGSFSYANAQSQSNFLAEVDGGDAASKYPNTFAFENTTQPADFNGWNVILSSGSAVTVALPEPGALGLLGLGLVGMGLLGRRRKA